jgi:hypothetical protein
MKKQPQNLTQSLIVFLIGMQILVLIFFSIKLQNFLEGTLKPIRYQGMNIKEY